MASVGKVYEGTHHPLLGSSFVLHLYYVGKACSIQDLTHIVEVVVTMYLTPRAILLHSEAKQ